MLAVGFYQALAAVGRSPPASLGTPRWRQAAAPLPMSTTASSKHRRTTLVSRAAINIPPDALVHSFRKTFGSDQKPQWGIKVENEGNENQKVIKLWFLVSGIDESRVKDEVEVDLPNDSSVLTIKSKYKAANDDLLDVRLLLTAGYNREGIKVETEKSGDKVLLEVTIFQKSTTLHKIDIK
ncbi:uncharacterized protein LOC133903682 [Phragmites australis]|uniref:uncharacterized protein LOC133903682 n=1 Tax=Phragmites australis TaxID=29695 RepID=UPI002D7A2E51|nr:uncharacterized protein LOC133903682 [Phragmites australis]